MIILRGERMLYLKAKDQLEHYEYGLGYNIDYEFPYSHTHDYWEFVFTIHDIEHRLNGEKTIISPQTLFIIKPNDVHSIKAANTEQNPNKEPTHLNVKVSDVLLKKMLAVYSENAYELLLKRKDLQMTIDGTASTTMKYFVSALMHVSNLSDTLALLKAVLSLTVNLFHFAIFQGENKQLTSNPAVEAIIIKMRSQKYLASSLHEITEGCNYSYMQLTRIFKNETGMTMQEFFTNIKMQYAASQLLLTNRLILDISNDIGFASLSHFNHIFKNKYGLSPSQYRHKQNF